jgi:hypothetical protein
VLRLRHCIRAGRAKRGALSTTVICTGFACTFQGHPYGEYLNMFLN